MNLAVPSRKSQKEQLRRQAHKTRLLADKRRRREGAGLAPVIIIEDSMAPKVLIVCEGINTEPSYFDLFKLKDLEVTIVGEGKNTLSLVDAAIKVAARASEDYDQKWIVMDKDDFPAANFDNAIHKAEANGFRVAYSNQAFEYWLLLHFEAHNGGGMHRKDCVKKLIEHLKNSGVEYNPDSKVITDELFDILKSKSGPEAKALTLEQLAAERAEKILTHHEAGPPSTAESSTTVQRLVKLLNEHT